MTESELIAQVAKSKHRYVRVQDDLHEMQCSPEGRLLLGCTRDTARNTMHFAVDGTVGDHAYGKFNLNPDGSLKGKVVIIADPKEMPDPSGLNQADTWFRMSAKTDASGQIKRHLDVGQATAIVPQGMKIPEGINAIYYDGTIEGRDKAVSAALQNQGVEQQQIGFRSWAGSDESAASSWSKAAAKALYPESAQYIHTWMHDSSLDTDLEMVGIKEKVNSFRESETPFFTNDEGVFINYIDDIESRQARHLKTIAKFFETANPKDIERGADFYRMLEKTLKLDLNEAMQVSEKINEKQALRIDKFCAIESKITQMAPYGGIHIAKAGSATHEKLSPDELTSQLLDGEIAHDTLVWIAGVTRNWQPITQSPFKDLYAQTLPPVQQAPAQPKQIQLEPLRRNGYPQPDRSAVECSVADAVQANPAKFLNDYVADERSFGGRYIAADLFKETFPEYRASKEARNRYNNPLHNSAAVLSAEMYRQRLASPANTQQEARQDTVIFLTGIPGAGKTSSILAGGQLPEHVKCVFEGQLSNPVTTFEKIQQALDAGLKPVIIAVHARPEDALKNTFKRFDEHGRGASIGVMASIQGGLPASLNAVQEKFGSLVQLQINDYRDRSNPKILNGWENLSLLQSEGNNEHIKNRLSKALELYASVGTISDACFRQAAGQPPIDIIDIAHESDEPADDGEMEQHHQNQYAENVGG